MHRYRGRFPSHSKLWYGGVRTLYVPAHLPYGERSMGAHFKPNSNLRFEIELLEVLTRDD
ncbi:peptidyl-prolyl cis-trans isomerase [Pseudomonas sp. 37 R 15]|nr:peptidyl-prolyl cis-trans isomerase [Pseudomonas sp. 37 R 15]